MADYAIYNTTTGEIRFKYSGTHPENQLFQPTDGYIEFTDMHHDDTTHYVVAGVLTARPVFADSWSTKSITADGTHTAEFGAGAIPAGTFTNILTPPGVADIIATVDTGTISLSTVVQGDHTVFLQQFPYQDHTQIIKVFPIGTVGLDDGIFSLISPPVIFVSNTMQQLVNTAYSFNASYIDLVSNTDQLLSTTKFVLKNTSMSLVSNYDQLLSAFLYHSNPGSLTTVSNYAQLFVSTDYDFVKTEMNIVQNETQLFPIATYSTWLTDLQPKSNLSQVLITTIEVLTGNDINITPNYNQLLYPGVFETITTTLTI